MAVAGRLGGDPKRVRRLLRVMGLEAIYPKPKLSQPEEGRRVYPYLLRDVAIERVDHVWSSDNTYIRMARSWLYLVAVIDWSSRYVLSWRLAASLESDFCVAALGDALRHSRSRQPRIFNTDQGSQFTSEAFTGRLKAHGVDISMDGRGRCLDHIFIERLWRSVKYEEVYLKDYQQYAEAQQGLSRYFRHYNHERPHQALGYGTPAEVYGARERGTFLKMELTQTPCRPASACGVGAAGGWFWLAGAERRLVGDVTVLRSKEHRLRNAQTYSGKKIVLTMGRALTPSASGEHTGMGPSG